MKLWGGRFTKETSAMVDAFNASIGYAKRLYEQDIQGSIAHATMLGEEGIIPAEDAAKIVEGLKGILEDARAGRIEWSTKAEDIHMNVETHLISPSATPASACIPAAAETISPSWIRACMRALPARRRRR